jgi:hypothetical protein
VAFHLLWSAVLGGKNHLVCYTNEECLKLTRQFWRHCFRFVNPSLKLFNKSSRIFWRNYHIFKENCSLFLYDNHITWRAANQPKPLCHALKMQFREKEFEKWKQDNGLNVFITHFNFQKSSTG